MSSGLIKNFLFILLICLNYNADAQNSRIFGKVSEKITHDSLSAALIEVEGISTPIFTSINGHYEIKGLIAGTYHLKFSFFSKIPLDTIVMIKENESLELNIELDEKINKIKGGGIKVKKAPKLANDITIIKEVKESNNVVNAIAGTTIAQTQARDAADVVKLIPGVTVIDNRFIMVRGLNDRYNSVFVNGAGTSGSEADKKSFSFDIIPSSLIDKILIYKTPSAELPGDFAGGMVKIFTKAAMPENKLSITFALGTRVGTIFNNFAYTKSNSWDFLGFGSKSRQIPVASLLNASVAERREATLKFNNTWGILNKMALPDGRFNMTYANKFAIKKLKFVSISNVNYTNTNTTFKITRKDFDPDRHLEDMQYTNLVRLGLLQNLSLAINERNSIDIRSLFNQFGRTQTTLRKSVLEDAPNERGYSMGYQGRSLWTTQINGNHENKNKNIMYTWTGSYSLTTKNEPDLRRIKYTKQQNQGDSDYTAAIPSGSPSPEFGVRFYSNLKEQLYSFGHNLKYVFRNKTETNESKKQHIEINFGNYLEFKDRHFEARLLGYVINTGAAALALRKLPVDQIFSEPNISNPNGFSLDEITEPNYTYKAQNRLFASYLTALIPFNTKFRAIAGARYEYNTQKLNSFLDITPLSVSVLTKLLLPSINISYDISKKKVVRFGYGKTLNRPEFREWSPFKFYDFDFGTDIYGSLFKTVLPGSGNVLKTATIDNFDLRLELYPSSSEYFHIGAFYKHFVNPIEQYILPSSNRIFTYANAASAVAQGIELDVRKNLNFIPGKVFKQLAFMTNLSIIKSTIKLNYSFGQDLSRQLQGQSPYVINSGFYYKNDSSGLQVSLLYNVIGPRIFLVGTSDYPSWGEMPKQNLDLTISKKLGKHFTFNFGIQDILNQASLIVQDSDKNGKFERHSSDLHIMEFKRGSYYTTGFKYTF